MLALLLAVGRGAPGAAAQDGTPPLVIDLSVHQVEIRYSFAGAELLLFGAIGEAAAQADRLDLAVALIGPPTPKVIRRKERVAGIWVNTDAVTFPNVPGFYHLASTRPLTAIADAAMLRQLRLAPESLALDCPSTREDLPAFRAALIRRLRQAGLVSVNEGGVTIRDRRLFRSRVDLPANVPTGDYRAAIYLFADGQLVAREHSDLTVAKVGFERSVYAYAQNRPLLYGLTAVVIALAAGWLAGLMSRR